MHDTSTPSARWTLSDLPFAARITIATFLLAVGVGYLGAIANLHFAEASPGNLLPTPDDVDHAYRGKSKVSQMERLLVAHPSLPFNGSGSMRSAFTPQRAGSLKGAVKKRAKDLDLNLEDAAQQKKAEETVLKELDGERLILVAWARSGFPKKPYEDDSFARPEKLTDLPVTPRFAEGSTVKIKSILEARCVRCHSEDVGGAGANYPLNTFDDVAHYTSAEPSQGKSLAKLALTTHVHLLGFSMLYILTGLALALSNCPAWIRVPVAPLALLASVADVACWWLARLDEPYGPLFAQGIIASGAVVAGALVVQIVLTSFSLFRVFGKLVLLLLMGAAAAGGYYAKVNIIDPHLSQEQEAMKSTQ